METKTLALLSAWRLAREAYSGQPKARSGVEGIVNVTNPQLHSSARAALTLQASKRDEHNGVTGCRLRAWLLFLGVRQDEAHVRDNRRHPGVHHALPKQVARPSTTSTTSTTATVRQNRVVKMVSWLHSTLR